MHQTNRIDQEANRAGKVRCRRRERKTCCVPLTSYWFWQPKATKLDFNGVAWLLLGELMVDLRMYGVVKTWHCTFLVGPSLRYLPMIYFFRNGLLHVSQLERNRSVAKGTGGQQQRWSRLAHSHRIVALQRELVTNSNIAGADSHG